MDETVSRNRWVVTLTFVEDDVTTTARAVLDDGRGRTVTASGWARRNPVDPSVPRVGEDLAAARSLSELAHELLVDASATLVGGARGFRAAEPSTSTVGRHLPVERELIHPGG